MADYGGRGGGASLRDALNAIMPMTGMGEYGAMFPPQAGAPQPGPPVPVTQQRPPTMAPGQPPLPQPRPPIPGQPVALPPGGVNLPPTYPAAQQLYLGLQPSYAQRLGLVR